MKKSKRICKHHIVKVTYPSKLNSSNWVDYICKSCGEIITSRAIAGRYFDQSIVKPNSNCWCCWENEKCNCSFELRGKIHEYIAVFCMKHLKYEEIKQGKSYVS